MKRFILLFFFSSAIIFADGILKTEGKKIVDINGTEIFLKGIGLGGWLVPEGYMLQMSGFANSPTEIKNKIIEVVGEANAEIFFEKYREYFVTEADIDSIASWGFNSVRLPMHYELLTPRNEPYVYTEKGFAIIDSLITWCKKNNLYLILDLHAAPGGQSDEPISDYDANLPSLWESEENKQRTIDLWREIASRYANEETIAGYDLLNEPKWDLGSQNADLRKLYIDITTAIRSVDTNHILFIEGNWFATNFDGLTPPWDGNLSYSFHKYWSEVTTASIQSYLSIRDNYNVPLWMSESGENSNSWFVDFIKLLTENNIGWSWWTHKKLESISSLTSSTISPQFQELLNYWSGNASKPSVDFAMAALMLQIENLKINNCDTKEDVIDALMRRPNDNFSIPYSQNNIPGKIYGVDFDYGNLRSSFYDTTPDNIGDGNYNNGWQYRNDGVDIEQCSDQITNGYNVGWIESGEWLRFTVNILQAGTYKIKFRIAAQNSDGKIMLILDNKFFTNLIDVPVTGGWQNWQTLEISDIELPIGKHDLIIRFYFGGFNFNYMEFEATAVGIFDSEDKIEEYSLEQNYPNPFNPSTIIAFEVPKKSHVELSVYNLLGQRIKTLTNKIYPEGFFEVKFDATEFSNGIYLINMEAENYAKTIKAILIK